MCVFRFFSPKMLKSRVKHKKFQRLYEKKNEFTTELYISEKKLGVCHISDPISRGCAMVEKFNLKNIDFAHPYIGFETKK